MNVLDILRSHKTEFLVGIANTLRLCLLIWPIGVLVGGILGVAGARFHLAIGKPSQGISFVLSGVPILVLLFWLHYPLQALLNVVIDPFITAVVALSIVNVFLVADLIRGVLMDFPAQYLLAAKVCGLETRDIVLRIQLPIVLRQVLPGLLVQQVTMLQATLFASLIGVDEIFRICQRLNSEIYKPVEIYSALAMLFLVVCLPLNGLALWVRQRFTRNLSER